MSRLRWLVIALALVFTASCRERLTYEATDDDVWRQHTRQNTGGAP